jgi:L-amino acid N-acyltransferase
VRLVACTHDEHGRAILDILNEAIVGSTAVYDYKPRAPHSMAAWFEAKQGADYPVVGAMQGNTLLGFASYGGFRAWPAYKYSIEHSVYVHKDHRGKGIGAALLAELITLGRKQNYHCMVGGIDVANTASIALHEKLGFRHAGTIRHAGFKFGRWLDLGFWQLLLDAPAQPRDG